MTGGRWLAAAVGLVIAVLLLAGCKEQGRALHLKKGVYVGNPDTPLNDETRRKLAERTAYQGLGGDVSGGARGR